jgi:hypothetical protein
MSDRFGGGFRPAVPWTCGRWLQHWSQLWHTIIRLWPLTHINLQGPSDFSIHQHSRYSIFEGNWQISGLSIAWIPLHTVFFSLFRGHVFFAFQHNLGTFCRSELLEVGLNFSGQIWSRSLILLFPQENRTFGISGINLCHLGAGAELSTLRCRKRFRGSITLKKNIF